MVDLLPSNQPKKPKIVQNAEFIPLHQELIMPEPHLIEPAMVDLDQIKRKSINSALRKQRLPNYQI